MRLYGRFIESVGNSRPDYYRLFHVQPDAPAEIIRASHRTLMQSLRMHPDLGGDHAQAVLLNEALEVLTNPASRAEYDRTRVDTGRPSDAAPGTTPAPPGTTTAPTSRHTCGFCGATAATATVERPDSTCHACGSALFLARTHEDGERSRRAIERLPRNMPMTFRRATAPADVLHAATEDVSLNGLRFVTQSPLQVGDRLRIDCQFCSAVTIVKSVIAKTTSAGPHYRVGVEFVTLRITHARGAFVSSVA